MLRPALLLVLAATSAAVVVQGAQSPGAATPGRPPRLSDLFGDDVIARGKGVEVKRSQLEEAFIAQKASLTLRGEQIPEERRTRVESQLLQQLIVLQILTNRVTAEDRKLADELVEKRLKETKEQAVSEEAFFRQLKAAGMTPDRFQRAILDESLAQAVIKREITSKIDITDAQVKDFYGTGTDLLVKLMQTDLDKLVKDPASTPSQVARFKERIDSVKKANLARLAQPEKVRVSHVFFTTRDRKTEEPLPEEQKKFKRQQLEKIRQKALGGADFAKLVQEFSEDRGLKETKGEYTLSREDRFVPEFKAAAFSLEPGKISDIVTSDLGLHVIKLLEKIPARKADFEKVAPDLREFLTQQEVQRAMPEYFGRLSKAAGLEVLDPKYKLEIADDSTAKKAGN
jgi:parvulin-like peptidyl-prolyl isomerase